MASIERLRASDGSANASVATVQSTRAPAATTIDVDTVLAINPGGFEGTMGTPHTFTDPITSETITVISEATAVDFTGHIDGSNIEIDDIAPGYTDAGSAVGDIIIIRPTTNYGNNLADVLDAAHDDDGTPSASAIHEAMPAGALVQYAGSSAPTGFLMCDGTSYLRATYADLFTAIGTTFGAVDGTHFTVPDMRGRVAVGVGASTKIATFASRSSNVITVTGLSNTADNEFQTGEAVLYTAASGAMTGLTHNTTYYVIRTGNLTFSLATTRANALLGTAIALSSNGTGTQTFTLTLTTRTLAETGGEEDHSLVVAEMPSHTHVQNSSAGAVPGSAYVATTDTSSARNAVQGSSGVQANENTGGSTAHNIMQPFVGLNYIIKT